MTTGTSAFNDPRVDDQFSFKCYKKKITSLMIRIPKGYCKIKPLDIESEKVQPHEEETGPSLDMLLYHHNKDAEDLN